MKLYKNILVTFLTAILTIFVMYGGYSIYAINEPDFTDVTTNYHFEMNAFFNTKLEKLVEMIDEDEEFFNDVDFKVPSGANPDNYSEKCSEDNVSSYCVSMQALEIYLNYVNTLNGLKGTVPKGASTLDEAFNYVAYRDQEMDEEVEEARMVMEATIAAYDEFKMAYPMHKQYELIIRNLVKYKLELKKVRYQVARFPEKFIDATSSDCE